MRIWPVLAFPLAITTASALGAPQPVGTLWQVGGSSLIRSHCKSDIPDDQYCRAIDLRDRGSTRRLGSGYARVRLVWSARRRNGSPDALVIGESGGSGGYAELFAITAGRNVGIKKFAGERLEGVHAKADTSKLKIDLPFDVEFFNGAPHAGAVIVPIPTVWRNGDFSADLSLLVERPLSHRQSSFVELAVREELYAWADAKYPSPTLFPPQSDTGTPVTLQALLDLILTGHADEAHALIHKAWPKARGRSDGELGGAEGFWKAVCKTVSRNPMWTRLGLDRLPHAEAIRAGAA